MHKPNMGTILLLLLLLLNVELFIRVGTPSRGNYEGMFFLRVAKKSLGRVISRRISVTKIGWEHIRIWKMLQIR